MKITLNGAAQEVTGSCTAVETGEARFLVDCGMFQGGRESGDRNLAPFPFDPQSFGFLLLTHAHIDHSGLLPKLVRDGFGGPIYTTKATADLLHIMLRDSAKVQLSDARRKRGSRRRNAAATDVVYTMADVEAALARLHTVDYDLPFSPHPCLTARFRDAGHILGSAIVEIRVKEGGRERKLLFSGDLGQPGRPILRDPCRIDDADILFVESTYGDRNHKSLAESLEELASVVNETLLARKGNVIIPAFAVGRTQELIYYFHQLSREGRLGHLNIFIDSPMAAAVTRVTRANLALFDEEARELTAWHSAGQGLPTLTFVGSADESRRLNSIRSGAIIIAGSGMCTAGRIRHHLLHNLPRRENAVLITGFQARGTLGRRLVDGDRNVRIFGQDVPVRASIHTLGGFSAHADQAALLGWLGSFSRPPSRTFVMHGEPGASAALTLEIRRRLGWNAEMPVAGETIVIDPGEWEEPHQKQGAAA